MVNKYEQNFLIPCYDTDLRQYLKPASFMNYAQEAANLHADILGFGYDDLAVTRTIWVLSRLHVKFLKHPKWRDKIKFQTWHKGPERLFYLRDFMLRSETGEPMVIGTSSWLVLNMDTRRIVRDAALDPSTALLEHAMETSCGKVQMPETGEKIIVKTHEASYSDLDMNGHVNNAIYLGWAMDVVKPEITSNKLLHEFIINFNHEIKPQDKVALYTVYSEDEGATVCHVQGMICDAQGQPDREAFCVKLIF